MMLSRTYDVIVMLGTEEASPYTVHSSFWRVERILHSKIHIRYTYIRYIQYIRYIVFASHT